MEARLMLGGFLSFCFSLFQQPGKEAEEQAGGDGGGKDVRYRLRKEHSKGLVRKEIWQDENERNQQNDLPQAGHKQADFCLTQRHEGLLAADLEADGKSTGKVDSHGPGGVADEAIV